jgi:hypothetical protein
MKKLFVLVAFFGMGAWLAGCGEEPKPAPKTGGMGGPPAHSASPGPRAGAPTDGDKDKDKDMDDDKGDKADGDADADKKDDDAKDEN